MGKKHEFKRIGMDEIEAIKELFIGVFTIEPWNDDWSNQVQLDLYLLDLIFSLEKCILDCHAHFYWIV